MAVEFVKYVVLKAVKEKSGGIRVIYYWITEDDQIFMLLAYPKIC